MDHRSSIILFQHLELDDVQLEVVIRTSSFRPSGSTVQVKILFHISDGVVDIGNGVEIMNVTDGARPVKSS
jgi:hypothetical protein